MKLTKEANRKLLLLWAKSSRDPAKKEVFHPLICHMLDVAAVTLSFWDKILPDAAKKKLADSLNISCEEARLWIAFWAGLHDIGKASPSFAVYNDKLCDFMRSSPNIEHIFLIQIFKHIFNLYTPLNRHLNIPNKIIFIY